ncbi:MAG TPA: hypothetical protein VD929_07880 [Caulobacteraceae bacterium]|nr:hypothetical protein [Caulobacteraceae bacterium]
MTERVENGARRGDWMRPVVWAGAAVLFAAPFVARQLTSEMQWNAFDFVVWGAMLGSGVLAMELAMLGGGLAYRFGAGFAAAAAIGLVWVNGAVGIIGSEDDRANLLFSGVLAVALLGALLARFRPSGMARAMTAAAVAQAGVAAAAIAMGWAGDSLPPLLGSTAFFCALWLISARLFAAEARSRTA